MPDTKNVAWANLLAYWEMDEASWNGTPGEVIDSKGSYHGTANGSLTTATGLINKAGSYSGGSLTYISGMAGPAISKSADFTVSVWMQIVADLGQDVGVLALGNLEFEIAFSYPGDIIYAAVKNTGTAGYDIHNTSVTSYIGDFTYHLYILTWDTATHTLKLYIDNSIKETRSVSEGTWGFGQFYIGKGSDAAYKNCPSGLIDQVCVWDKKLSTAEMTALYNSGAGCLLTGPAVAYSSMSKSSGEIDDVCNVMIIGTDLDLATSITWDNIDLPFTLIDTTHLLVTVKGLSDGTNPFVLEPGTISSDNFEVYTSEFAQRPPTISKVLRYGKFTGAMSKKIKFIQK